MSTRNKCKVCSQKVQAKDKALSCDVCLNWWHIRCLNIPEQTYEIYNDDNISWFCDNCKDASKVLRNQMVNMQQRIDELEKRLETLENAAASKEEAAEIAKNEIHSEDTAKLIEDTVEKKLGEQPIVNKMTTLQTVQEYINDISEVEKRRGNLVIHKLPESPAEEKEEQENEDKNQIKEILKHIDPDLPEDAVSKTTRLGQKTENNNRPVLIEFNNKETSSKILKNVKVLKDSRWQVSISKDLPKSVRQLRNHIMAQAKQTTPNPEHFLFKLVGEPGKERVVKVPKNAP